MTVRTYTPYADSAGRAAPVVAEPRRWAVALAGCAVMALCGGGLAAYLDLTTVTAAAGQPSDAPPLN
jgi:hypothetical protein